MNAPAEFELMSGFAVLPQSPGARIRALGSGPAARISSFPQSPGARVRALGSGPAARISSFPQSPGARIRALGYAPEGAARGRALRGPEARGRGLHDRTITVAGMDAMVIEWVAARLDMPPADFLPCTAVAVVHGAEMLAGAVYYQFRPNAHGGTMEAALASVSPRWCTRAVLASLFAYPFAQVKVARLQVSIAKKNKPARRLAERLSFKLEGVGRRLWDGRQDAVIYSMLPEECRWLQAQRNGHMSEATRATASTRPEARSQARGCARPALEGIQ